MPGSLQNSLLMRGLNAKRLDTECIEAIKRTLLLFRNDPQFRGKGKRVPLRQFSDLCGVSRVTLYDVMRGERQALEHRTRDRILHAIALVIHGGLRWQRSYTNPVREIRTIKKGTISWTPVMPNGDPPPLIRRREPRRGKKEKHGYANL